MSHLLFNLLHYCLKPRGFIGICKSKIVAKLKIDRRIKRSIMGWGSILQVKQGHND